MSLTWDLTSEPDSSGKRGTLAVKDSSLARSSGLVEPQYP